MEKTIPLIFTLQIAIASFLGKIKSDIPSTQISKYIFLILEESISELPIARFTQCLLMPWG